MHIILAKGQRDERPGEKKITIEPREWKGCGKALGNAVAKRNK